MNKLLALLCLTLAFFGCGTSGGGGFAPSAPTGVTAAPGNAQVTISWSAITGASYYNIYWSTTNGVTPGSGTRISGATNPFTQSGLTNDTTYYYVVTAVGSGGESAPSLQVSATPSASGANAPYIWATLFTLDPGTSESPYFGSAFVFVCSDIACSSPISNAIVIVNGVTLLYYQQGLYYDNNNLLIAEGASATVNVNIGGNVYSASGTQFTTPPTITAPTSPATWTVADANTISWTGGAPTDNADYYVQMYENNDSNLNQVFPLPANSSSGELPFTTTSVTVPANSLPTGSLSLQVGIVSQGAIYQTSGGIPIPDAGPTSALWFGLLAPIVAVTAQ